MKLLTLLLAPWLIVQGKRVRANTVRLPEAKGPRHGAQGHGELLRVLVLGDSAAAGVGCECQTEAVSGQLAQALAQTYHVQWQLIAQSSLTCAGVLDLLKRSVVALNDPIDAVLVSVGVNDVTRRTTVSQWRDDLNALSRYLTETFQARQIIYTSLPPMHVFPALPQPLRWYLGQQARQLDKHLQHHCQTMTNAVYLDLNMPFEPQFIATDGYHPSAAAATIWGQAAAALVQRGGDQCSG
ncbi:SGNH/GDSL hydrolase family protein [Pseudidiomarina taiwanensis]|nr:SGNH/GDSL hydrolase family protein [Pseudidiomarina taiwanensis]